MLNVIIVSRNCVDSFHIIIIIIIIVVIIILVILIFFIIYFLIGGNQSFNKLGFFTRYW